MGSNGFSEGVDMGKVLPGAVRELDSLVYGLGVQWRSLGDTLCGLWGCVDSRDLYEAGSSYMGLMETLGRVRSCLRGASLGLRVAGDSGEDIGRGVGKGVAGAPEGRESGPREGEDGRDVGDGGSRDGDGSSGAGSSGAGSRGLWHCCDSAAHNVWGAVVDDFKEGGMDLVSLDTLSYTSKDLFRAYAEETSKGPSIPPRMRGEGGVMRIPCVSLYWREGFVADVGDVWFSSEDDVLGHGVTRGVVPVPLVFGEMVYEGESRVWMLGCFMRYFMRCMWIGVGHALCLLHEELVTGREVSV